MSNGLDLGAPVKDHTGYDTSDAALQLPAMSVTHYLEGGNETVPTVTRDGARRFSLRKARSHNDIEVGASVISTYGERA
jgi:hypothetical protein